MKKDLKIVDISSVIKEYCLGVATFGKEGRFLYPNNTS
jgi:hypothetical protein